MNAAPPIDADILASESFNRDSFRLAALTVANRIRKKLGLPEMDRLPAGHRDDRRWGNPVVFTIGAGAPQLAARLESVENRIVVDSPTGEIAFRPVSGSVINRFVQMFEAGRFPELEVVKETEHPCGKRVKT